MSPEPERPPGRPDHVVSYDEVRPVLVIRALPGLGDMLCAGPALRSLRHAVPRADVALLGLPLAEPSLDLAGRLTLGPLAALFQQARLAVANDTGTSHLSVAVQVPSVVVYGGPDPSDPRRWAPLDTSRHRAVVPAGPRWPKAIEVLDEVDGLLATTGRAGGGCGQGRRTGGRRRRRTG